jgi:hypothetical protein
MDGAEAPVDALSPVCNDENAVRPEAIENHPGGRSAVSPVEAGSMDTPQA